MMNFDELVGQTFFERELFDLLKNEIESRFQQHRGCRILLYFDRGDCGRIRIRRLARFNSVRDLDQQERRDIEKEEWVEICDDGRRFTLILVRIDRAGWLASIREAQSHTQVSYMNWLDEYPPLKRPMTVEEMRKGFQELAGIFEEQVQLRKTRKAKAV